MKIIKSYMTNNPCYKEGVKITVKGLMLHSVGCAQPKASVFIGIFNKSSYDSACVHGFIDGNTGDTYQTLPWNYYGWHCGASANRTHIGVEMCEPAEIKYTGGASFTVLNKAKAQACAKRTYNSAVELFAILCKQYKLDPTKKGVIISHKEGGICGVASGHVDPEHLWKGLGLSYTMDTFRKAVKSKMGTASATTSTSNATATTKPNTSSYLVRISISDLNIRKGPGTNYSRTGKYTGKGVFTIVQTSNGTGSAKGWGKLKSGAGWVALDYCTKI